MAGGGGGARPALSGGPAAAPTRIWQALTETTTSGLLPHWPMVQHSSWPRAGVGRSRCCGCPLCARLLREGPQTQTGSAGGPEWVAGPRQAYGGPNERTNCLAGCACAGLSLRAAASGSSGRGTATATQAERGCSGREWEALNLAIDSPGVHAPAPHPRTCIVKGVCASLLATHPGLMRHRFRPARRAAVQVK